MLTYTLRLPGLPKTYNQTRYNTKTYRIEKWRWFGAIQKYCLAMNIRPPRPPLEKCEINYTLGSLKMRDYDNLVSSFKVITDCIVRHGFLKDDNPNVILKCTYSQVFARRNEGFVSIEIKEVSNGT